jgi:tRNA(Arg) A34 adenosine deaminase TadA
MKLKTSLTINLPDWVDNLALGEDVFVSDKEKMGLVIKLAELNVKHRTGGPFGAAVFNSETGALVSIGVNCVIPAACSIAHAEIVAIVMAQSYAGNYRLDINPKQQYVLVTSAQPCAMCFGAIPWSGIKRIVCGARSEDVERITGFDEGPLHPEWIAQLNNRGIEVAMDILRDDVCRILKLYVDSGGVLY